MNINFGISKSNKSNIKATAETTITKLFAPPHLQVYGNDDTQCPERAGGKNASRLYIDSSEPSPGGTGKWTADETLRFTCYNEGGSDNRPVQCECQK